MGNVSVQIEDEYNCLHHTVPTNPNEFLEQLTKVKTKISFVSNANKTKSNERRNSNGLPNNLKGN